MSNAPVTAAQWLYFVDRLLLSLGCLALLVSLSFFISYNWDYMTRLHKFVLIESTLTLLAVGYVKAPKQTVVSEVLLICITLCVGTLLAYFGQTYQTGADPWQLFANWALLVIPIVVIGRSVALWLSWIVLVNLAVSLYIMQVVNVRYFYAYLWAIFAICILCLIVWELLARRLAWLDKDWAMRLLLAVCVYAITLLTCDSITGQFTYRINFLLYFISVLFAFYYYRRIKPDLLSITLVVASLNWVAFIVVFHQLFTFHFTATEMFVLGAYVLGAISLCGWYLQSCYKKR